MLFEVLPDPPTHRGHIHTHNSNLSDFNLVKSGVECKSGDEFLGKEISIAECANACKEKAGCNFFVFGTGSKDGECYWEKTSTAGCPEGWKQADYNFYESKSM